MHNVIFFGCFLLISIIILLCKYFITQKKRQEKLEQLNRMNCLFSRVEGWICESAEKNTKSQLNKFRKQLDNSVFDLKIDSDEMNFEERNLEGYVEDISELNPAA